MVTLTRCCFTIRGEDAKQEYKKNCSSLESMPFFRNVCSSWRKCGPAQVDERWDAWRCPRRKKDAPVVFTLEKLLCTSVVCVGVYLF